MKTLARRNFLQQLGCLVGVSPSASDVCSPVVPRMHKRRITQSELEAAFALHAIWLEDESRGTRAVFSNCDLSGLDFLSSRTEVINLRGSDFTEADMSAITGNQVSFHLASLQSARLSWSQLKLPILCGATMRRALCNHVLWGWPSQSAPIPPPSIDGWRPRATFINTDLSLSNFQEARVLGYFSGTRFSGATLHKTDLSYSEFDGIQYCCENSFAGSDVFGAKFRYATIEATNFRSARLYDLDFSFAKIGSKCSWPAGFDFTLTKF